MSDVLSLLNIKDENGNWISVPGIKGEKGDQGDPAPADAVVPAVESWLNEHPEATTTVQDGSIGSSKFTEDLKKETLKDYVTPQMFGAAGNGTTDDSAAFQSCLNAAQSRSILMLIPRGNYYLASPMVANSTSPFRITGQISFTTNGSSIITCPNGFISAANGVCQIIENLALVGNNSSTAITISGRWYRLRNLFIRKFEYGIYSTNSPYSVIENVEINTCANGIFIHPIGTTIQNCHVHGCTEVGIESNTGNSLNIIGLIQESNGTHIKLTGTDYVTIANSYIGDDSNIWIQNDGATHVKIRDLIQSVGGPRKIIVQSAGSMEVNGEYYAVGGGIEISGGVLDLTNLKEHTALKYIENTGGWILAEDSKYQNGYSLAGTGFSGAIVENGVNYANNPCLEIWSKQASYNPNVNVNIPGIAFNFLVPERMIGHTMYLHFGGEDYVPRMDMSLTGAELAWDITPAPTRNSASKMSDTSLRLSSSYTHWDFPITVTDKNIQVVLKYTGSNGTARECAMLLKYMFLNADNRINIPVKWEEATA